MSTPALPPEPPTAAEVVARDEFEALAAGSLVAAQAAAEKWRTGAAALVTLAAGGAFAKGPGAFNDIGGDAQRWAVVGLGFLGLVCALLGFWYTLRAGAGDWAVYQREEVMATYGSPKAFQVAQAMRAATNLEKGKEWLVAALLLLVAGSFVWVVAPKPAPSLVVKVTPATGEPYCGALKSADNQRVRVQVSGESAPRELGFAEVRNLAVASSC